MDDKVEKDGIDAPVDDARREFLGKAGRFAAITPPAVTLLLGTSLGSRAIAGSSGSHPHHHHPGGSKGKPGKGDKGGKGGKGGERGKGGARQERKGWKGWQQRWLVAPRPVIKTRVAAPYREPPLVSADRTSLFARSPVALTTAIAP
jgi:hypothetical protein